MWSLKKKKKLIVCLLSRCCVSPLIHVVWSISRWLLELVQSSFPLCLLPSLFPLSLTRLLLLVALLSLLNSSPISTLSTSFTVSVTLSLSVSLSLTLSLAASSNRLPISTIPSCPPAYPRCNRCHCSDNYLLRYLCHHHACLLLPSVPS